MAAGLISEVYFQRCAVDLKNKSTKMNDGWELNQHQGKLYLYKKLVQHLECETDMEEATVDSEEVPEDDDEVDAADDDACLAVKGDHFTQPLTFEYHIVYSESYSVPVLYFNVYKPDGGLLPLDSVWHLIPAYYQERLQQDRWTFLTQQEHPYFGRPFYHLHPCHTEALMSCVMTIDQSKSSNYLIGWLSTVGPVVHLSLPLDYGLEDCD